MSSVHIQGSEGETGEVASAEEQAQQAGPFT